MEEGQPSQTAIAAAIARAAHFLLDDDPKIFEDHLAFGLSGIESEAALLAAHRATPAGHARRAFATLRQRYSEEVLEDALARGTGQYVILGAGLDSFAYRRSDLTEAVRVFEVDHPATQEWKRARLQSLHIGLPSNLTFVPVDFEQRTLAEGLRSGGLSMEIPTVFSWLGVTMYLTDEAVFETLRFVATLPPGSEIVFQYVLPAPLLNEEGRRILATIEANVAARGEPLVTLYEPATLAARVRELGFTRVLDLSPQEADARYFAGRTDGLHTPPHTHLMRARV
jgi:methyltransferase (TIGR00027 family)